MTAFAQDIQRRIQDGTWIKMDDWKMSTECNHNEFQGVAQWRVDSASYSNVTYSVDVKVTGRGVRYNVGTFTEAVRILITFKDEDNADVHAGGWLCVSTLSVDTPKRCDCLGAGA